MFFNLNDIYLNLQNSQKIYFMLRIINATWGYKGYFIDVADILRKKIDSKFNLKINLDKATLGDPCLFVKELNVVYDYGGTKHQILVQEHHDGTRTLKINRGIATTNTRPQRLLKISGLV